MSAAVLSLFVNHEGLPRLTAARPARATVIAAPPTAQDDAAQGSAGSMAGVTPQRTNAYATRGVGATPGSLLWKSYKLFSLKSTVYTQAETGPFRFELPLPTDHHATAPVLAGGVIYLTVYNGDGYVIALDAADGKPRGRFKNAGTAVSSLAAAGGVIYAGGSDGVFYAFDTAAGRERWRVSDGYSFSAASPALADGVVYFVGFVDKAMNRGANVEGVVYAVDAAGGKTLWSLKVKGYPTPVAVGGGAACFADGDGHLYAVDGRTGKERWKFKAGGTLSRPAIMNDAVFFRDRDENLYAVDLAAGKLRWKKGSPGAATFLAVDRATVYFGGEYDSLYAVDAATGERKWRFKTDKRCTAPVLADGAVYTSCRDKKLYAVDATTGRELWQYKTGEHVAAPPIISDGTIYFLDREAQLHALR